LEIEKPSQPQGAGEKDALGRFLLLFRLYFFF
jgi:hypothetical protein